MASLKKRRDRGALTWLVVLAGLCSFPLVAAAEDLSAFDKGLLKIDETDLRKHVNALASDALEGRQVGTRGGKAAAAYLRTVLKSIRDSGRLPQEETQEFGHEYQNLLIRLPGSDDRLRNETVIVGAHYDHVGFGNPSNSQGPFGQIHNGADDNASGTSAVLELIEAFSSLPVAPARSILFAFWDGEEAGLLGSKHWVSHPTIPLENVRVVLNLDMLGRLRNGRVTTMGWRSAPGLRKILATHNEPNDLLLLFQPRVIADSDHYPFYSSRIPSIHLDTEKHDDYHRPSDDADKINWPGLQRMSEYAYRLVSDFAARPELPEFRREALRELPPAWMTSKEYDEPPIRLGVSWDEDEVKRNNHVITQIFADSPAANAGLKVGDRIIRLGPWENGSFSDLKTTLQIVKNPVSIRVQRPGTSAPVDLSATLWGTPVRLGGGWVEDSALPDCVVMTHVIKESPAERAGLAAGDIIMQMGGKPITSTEEMRLRVVEEPGPFIFRVERHGRIREVKVDLFDRPSPKRETIPSDKSLNDKATN